MKTKKIIVVFDANSMAVKNKTGVGKYTERLVKAVATEGAERVELVGYYFNFLGRKRNLDLVAAPNITYRRILFIPGPVVNLLRRFYIEIPVELFSFKKADINLYPNYLTQPSIFRSKTIAVIHDLTYKFFPESMSEKNRHDLEKFVPKTLKRADAIFAVSETTKESIVDTYKYAKDIFVTPIPFEQSSGANLLSLNQTRQKLGIQKEYLLFVGTIEPRKNLDSLVKAFNDNQKLKEKYALVICGQTDWKYEQTLKRIKSAQAKGAEIILTGYVDDAYRNSLLKNCVAFVSSSFYEGFGMPIIEAMSFDKAVVISDIPIFHEVARDYGVYFNPRSSDDIADTLLRFEPRANKAKKPPYTFITWQQVAQDVLKAFESVLRTK